MLQRYRQTTLQYRFVAVLAFCLLALQVARFAHVHDDNSGHLLQDCHICSQIGRLGHAPPVVSTPVLPSRPVTALRLIDLPDFQPPGYYSTTRARAPPFFS
ncbi:MAG TPA: hypothetical protein VFP95_01365 [Gammaproteobacteria bacterium]|nr:hypothetical protein [Gammaproteobacteria bacterium]